HHRAALQGRHRPAGGRARRRRGRDTRDGSRVSVTENRLHGDPGIDGHEQHPRRSALVETDMQRDRARTIYEKSVPGRRAFVGPELDVPEHELPERFRRAEPPELPEIAEPEIVRHYNRL